MEGAHLSSSSDSENYFDTKKSKDKKKAEVEKIDPSKVIERHLLIPREVLHQQEKRPESKAEVDDDDEESEDQGMSTQERQYAAQALRRESQRARHEVTPDSDLPPALIAGDLLVEEWDERIEDGQDLDQALSEILSKHNIAVSLGDSLDELTSEQLHDSTPFEAESTEDSQEAVALSNHEVIINPHTQHHESLAEDELPVWHQAKAPVPKPSSPNRSIFGNSPHERRDTSSTPPAVISGIIGNFLGNRRGRTKTEKKLLPVQRKLEKQVSDLSWELKAKEAKIRSIAAEHVQNTGPSVIEKIRAHSSVAKEWSPELMNEEDRTSRYIHERESEQRDPAPEAKHLHGGHASKEHIGHMLIAESEKPDQEVDKASSTSERLQMPPNKRIETIGRQELIEMSGKIEVEGTNLRQIYESHLIGEHALRRLVAEHVHGGDVAKALKREIVEHEIDFERDPALRDLSLPTDDDSNESAKVTAPGKESLNELLQKAEAGLPSTDEDHPYYKDRSESVRREDTADSRKHVVDIAMATIIVLLAIIVLTLYLRH